MKNLENYGVHNLDAREIREIDGGLIGIIFLCALVVAAPIAGWYSNPPRKAHGQP